MKKAVISIGSNSTRLLVAECGDELRDRHLGRAETRLFMGLDAGGSLEEKAMDRTVRAIYAMNLEALARGAEKVDLIATSAARDAVNCVEFEKRILDETGLELCVIPGEEEAEYAFIAASGGLDRAVMDIGGGSTEYTRGNNGNIQFARSTRMGASRLLRQLDITNQKTASEALNIAVNTLRPAADEMNALPKAEILVGLGGTCTTAAAIQRGYYFGSEDAEGDIITMQTAREQLEMLADMSDDERKDVPGLPETRIKHMPHGLCIMIASMELLGFDKVSVSGLTILDGYLLKHK